MFLGSRLFRVQVFQGPDFSGSRFFRVQVFLDPGFSRSRFFRVEVQGPGPDLEVVIKIAYSFTNLKGRNTEIFLSKYFMKY